MKKRDMMKGLLSVLFFFVAAAFAMKQPLLPAQAFEFSAKQKGNTVVAHWTMAPGYYLYKDKFKFETSVPDVQLDQVTFPKGIQKDSVVAENHEVYKKELELIIPFTANSAGEGQVKIVYQGCAEEGFCYPPMKKEVSIQFEKSQENDQSTNVMSSPSEAKSFLQKSNGLILLLGFFGFGLLLSFTPCVLPMIPILSSIILGQGGKIHLFRSFNLSLTYVLGMSIAYAIAGLLASLAGGHLQAYMQSPFILTVFSLLFVLLALSLFGVYEIRMPHFLHHHVTHWSNKQKGGTFVGTFIMGFLSILIVSPCVSAPLVAALGLISQKGNLILGGFALWAMGFGMGVPLLLIGTFGPRLLPKAGKWMHVVKAAFGVSMIGLAIMLLSRFLPGFIVLMLWACLFIITAINMGILTALPTRSSGRVWHGIGYIFFVYGIILLMGAAQGNNNPLMPLQKTSVTQISSKSTLNFQFVTTLDELQQALAKAKGHYVMVDFFADWCVSCHQLEYFTFVDSAVQEKLKDFVLIKADVTLTNAASRMIEEKYGVIAPPTILFFNPKGDWLKNKTVVGEINPEEFLQQLSEVK